MRNFFETSKILFTFHFSHFRKRCLVSKKSNQFRKFIKKTYCKETRKIILKYFSSFKFRSHYYRNPHALLEDIYIYLDVTNIDLQKCNHSFAVEKEMKKIEEEMKWLKEKEGVDLP